MNVYIFTIDPYESIFEIYSTKENAEKARAKFLERNPEYKEDFESIGHTYGNIEEYELDSCYINDTEIIAKGKVIFVKEDEAGYRHYKFEPPLPQGTKCVSIEGLGAFPLNKNQKEKKT